MDLRWRKTISGTRVLYDGETRVGHVRNAGPKRWHCDLYWSGELKVMDSLQGGKLFVETAYQVK